VKERYAVIKRLSTQYPISKLCQVLDLARSGYYSSWRQPCGKRAIEDVAIRRAILTSHNAAPSYGVDNIHADVREKLVCGRNRIRRLMRDMGVRSCRKRPYRIATTNSNHDYAIAPNLVKNLDIVRPNQVWVSDITYIQTDEGFLFAAIVKDKFTREIVGYSCGERITSELARLALDKAIASRQPKPGLIHHSDRGVQYCCHDYRDNLKQNEITASMSKKGNPYDNAMAENFFCCLKCEKLYLEHYSTRAQAKLAVFEYIEGFYNTRRRHSALARIPPARFFHEYEATHVTE
jgi:putative transposase